MFRTDFFSLRFYLVGLGFGLLCACGLPGPGSSTNPQETPVEEQDYEDVVNVRIETNRAMRTTWQGDLFNLVTPQLAWALSGLEENNSLSEQAISVITMDLNFQERGRIADPFVVDQPSSRLGYDLLFQATVEKQLNRLVRVTLPNGEVMYAPLAPATVQGNNYVQVSVASHYVLKKLYEAITTREQLTDLLACDNRDTNCSHQSRVKATHILNLIELVNEYDLVITPEMTVQTVMDMFEDNLYLRTMVETGIQEIVRTTSPATHGTAREFRHLDGYEEAQLSRALTYNSALFALDLSAIKNSGNVNRVNLGVSISRTVPINTDFTPLETARTLPIYPRLTHTSDFVETRKDALTFTIPFTRSLTTYTSDNIFITPGSAYQKHATTSIDSFLSTQGNLMAGTVLEQHIDMNQVGWQSNPVYKQLYRVNQYEPNLSADQTASNTPLYPDSAPWLVSANVIKAENYSVVKPPLSSKYERVDWLEDRHVFSWEIHAEETDTDFTSARMRGQTGKTYGVLRYGLQLGNSNPVVQLTAEILQWKTSPGSDRIESTQLVRLGPFTSSPLDAHYRSWQLARNADHTMVRIPADETGPNILAPQTDTHSYTAIPTTEDDNDPLTSNTSVSHNKGLINVDGGTQPITGHVSSNGSHFALVMHKTPTNFVNRAFMVGTELHGGPGLFEDVRYQLQGNTMTVSTEETRLTNLNQSTLVLSNLNNSCEAELTVRAMTISHDIEANTIGAPERPLIEEEAIPSTECSIVDSKITLVFGDPEHEVLDQPLTLTGFFSKAEDDATTSNLINLLWLQEDNMGLVFATRDQELDPAFENQPIND